MSKKKREILLSPEMKVYIEVNKLNTCPKVAKVTSITKRKKKREIIERDGKFYTKRGTELTRASNTMSEAEFFAFILSALRKATRFWKPKMDKLLEQRRDYKGPDKRIKYEYQCEQCLKWWKRSEVEADHIVPCGGMNSWDKLVPWCQKALVEKDDYQVLCSKNCHRRKTNEERNK